MYSLASSPGSLRVSHRRAWYFFSRDLTYKLHVGRDRSKDCCASLPFAGDSVSVLSLWYKRAPKSSYKKCSFAAFLRCLRTAAVLPMQKFTLLPPFYPPYHVCEKTYQAHMQLHLKMCLFPWDICSPPITL